MLKRSIVEIEDDLDALQLAYINEEDEFLMIELESKFSHFLAEATEVDGQLRIAAGITINNWVRETSGH